MTRWSFEPGFPRFVSMARGYARLYLSEHTGRSAGHFDHLNVKDDAVSEEFGIPVDEEGLAGRECDLTDSDGNRLRIATRPRQTRRAAAMPLSQQEPVNRTGLIRSARGVSCRP